MPANNILKIRRGTAEQWAAANPVLSSGEPGYDTTNKILKIGDGTTPWLTLSYSPAGGATDLDSLTDVAVSSPTNGQVLKFNGTSWVNAADATGGGATDLDSLTDVAVSSPTNGQVLKFNGTSWVNAADATGGGNPFDQPLNTTDDATFVNLNVTSITFPDGSVLTSANGLGGTLNFDGGSAASFGSGELDGGNATSAGSGVIDGGSAT